jgi:hypothetical protein
VITLHTVLTTLSLFFTIIVIFLLIWRNKLNRLNKNISYLLKLKNSIFNERRLLIYLIIEILIHLIQPYPQIEKKWIIQTLGIRVIYNLNSILTGFTLLRMYVWLRIAKTFNKYYIEDIRALSHFDISSIYTFLYRSNVRHRPIYTMMVIFLFFLFIWSMLFIVYERFQENGPFDYTWNVFWMIVVTITTSNIL